MNTVFVVQVDYRKDVGRILGTYSTREKAVDAVMAVRNWESYLKDPIFCNPVAGFWSTEEDSYQIEGHNIQ